MDYIPGKEPTLEKLRTIVSDQPLSFPEQIQAIMQLCMALNLTHHRTPTTGEAVAHKDIKPDNVKLHVTKNNNNVTVIDAYLLDFGISETIEDSPDATKLSEPQGTPVYLSTAFYNTKKISSKADIYSLAGVIGMILEGKDVAKQKRNLFKDCNNNRDTQHFDAFLKSKYTITLNNLPVEYQPLSHYLLKFLNRMQENTYEEQPNTDEVLKFFTLMNQICLQFQQEKQEQLEQLEQVILLEEFDNFHIIQNIAEIKNFSHFQKEFELLIQEGNYQEKKVMQRIKTELENEKFSQEFKIPTEAFLTEIKAIEKPEDRLYPLTLLADSLSDYNEKGFISEDNLLKINQYSLKCEGNPSPKIRATGISMITFGILLIGFGTLCLVLSLATVTTGLLAPLGAIGVAASAGMIGSGVAFGSAGIGLFHAGKPKGESASAINFMNKAKIIENDKDKKNLIKNPKIA